MKMLKKYWQEMCEMLRLPTVKKRVDAELGIYARPGDSKPVFCAKINGNWRYPLICALRVMAGMMALLCLLSLVFGRIKKLFS